MLTSDVIRHFGGVRSVAAKLGIRRTAVYAWGEMVPPLRAAKLADLSGGVLTFDPDDYEHWNRRRDETVQG